MSAGDILILLVLTLVLALIFRSASRKKKTGCSGDCAHCGQVDWEKIRCELREEKERKRENKMLSPGQDVCSGRKYPKLEVRK